MTLQQRLEALATAIRNKLNLMTPRLQPQGGAQNQVLAKNTANDYDSSWLTLTKGLVGLGSVDNTADSVKAVFSATKLATPRAINGVNFDGSAAITINAVDATARLASSAVSAFGLTLIDDADAATARGTLGLGSLATQSAVTSLQVTTALGFTPYNSTNPNAYISSITGGMVTTALGYTPTSITGYTGAQTPSAIKTALAITKADVGLGSADNTADSAKNVLSATKLTTARTINGVAFDGSANITINAVDSTPRIATDGVAQIAVGSAAAPSLTFTGDTDTGAYRSAANTFAISAGGALAADFSPFGGNFWAASGNNCQMAIISGTGAYVPSLLFYGNGGASNIGSISGSADASNRYGFIYAANTTAGLHKFTVNAVERLLVSNTGVAITGVATLNGSAMASGATLDISVQSSAPTGKPDGSLWIKTS